MCAQHPHRFFFCWFVVAVVVVVCMFSIHVAHAAHFLTSLSLPTVLPPPPSSSSASASASASFSSSLTIIPLPKTEQNHSAHHRRHENRFSAFRSPPKQPNQIVASRWSPSASYSVVVLQHEMNHWFGGPPVREPQHPDELHGSWLKPANCS